MLCRINNHLLKQFNDAVQTFEYLCIAMDDSTNVRDITNNNGELAHVRSCDYMLCVKQSLGFSLTCGCRVLLVQYFACLSKI
jgi:hypothetical protein